MANKRSEAVTHEMARLERLRVRLERQGVLPALAAKAVETLELPPVPQAWVEAASRGYFGKHAGRLNYAERLEAGRAIGSGQVEGKAKTLGLRLKARGARWRSRNVLPMASLVCVRHSSQWDAYWAVAA